MEARRRRSSQAAAAAMGLLLFASSFWSQAAAAAVGAATELQKHVAFFDSDHDGIISFSETYNGFRALGFGVVTSELSATLINGALGPKTKPENATGSQFSIYIENIHKGVHGSDSGAYDSEGRFVHEKFDEIFTKHAKTVPDGLTSAELEEMLRANRKPNDHNGWLGASTEWETTFTLAKDKDGFLRKDTVRAVYDGSLFSKLASEKKARDRVGKGAGRGGTAGNDSGGSTTTVVSGDSDMAAAAAVPLLLLSAACFCSQPAVGGDAPATELQKHVAFFDSDHDGIISFGETYRGLRALGFGVVSSTVSATFINGDIGPKTRPEHAEGSWFSIYVENIHKGIHGSDTGAFDSEGRFVSEKFDEIFTKHAKTVPDGLTSDELDEMLHANAHTEHKDGSGWLQAATEWRTTYEIAKDKDDFLRKDTLRAFYDGSIFSKLASEND
uniref:EF-hand domain-containing protein n=1 Tax=Oryza punctata TaxID=4537 RepID=A0A0E0K4Z0_ORYPU